MAFISLQKLYYKDKDNYQSVFDNRFESENSLHFDFKINGNDAFIYLHKEICFIANQISLLDKKVNNILNLLPDIANKQYIKKSLIDEVVYTNEIEGIISTRKEINEIIVDIENKHLKENKRFQSLVQKYNMLMKEDFKPIQTPNDIRNIYDNLVLDEIIDLDKADMPDGTIFRANQVFVKNEVSGAIIHEGVIPESNIISMMSQAINILNDETIEPIIRIAVFHYVFSYIHPFYDGNGRTNRYISSLYLKEYYSPIIAYRLSLTIKKSKKKYYDAFKDTNDKINKADIGTFVYEFVEIVKKAFEETVEYLTDKQNELKHYEELINNIANLHEKEANLLYVLSQIELFGENALSREDLANITNVSIPTTIKYLEELVTKNYILSHKEGKKELYQINLEKLNK